MISKIKREHKRIIIGTDQNLDYLKINSMKFFDINLTHNLKPTICKPTRVTHNSATLIDDIYIDAELILNVKSHIIVTNISDHFLCIAVVKNSRLINTSLDSYTTRRINGSVLRDISGALMNKDWNILNNYQLMEQTIPLIQR